MRVRQGIAPAIGTAVLALLVAAPTAGHAGSGVQPPGQVSAAQAAAELPNVVVVVADDQAESTMDAMPTVRSQITDLGVSLKTGVIPTSTCCPSRSALLSGKYSHTTGVYLNKSDGWSAFYNSGAEADTFAVALNNLGYRTGMFGKYLNGFALAPPDYVPPGWDTFQAIWDPDADPRLAAGAYYDYIVRGTEPNESYGEDPSDYSTDVIANMAVDFISAAPPDQPLLVYTATAGPHEPFTPAPRHAGLWHREELPPSVTQLTNDRADHWPDQTLNYFTMQTNLKSQHEALMSVDEAVGDIIDALGPERTANTLFIYLSDNGLQFGEHGLQDKYVPFSGSTDVPMFLRWDGHIAAGTTYPRPVTNADLGETIVDAVGTSLASTEGVSFFEADRPHGILLEGAKIDEHPAYCGWRTRRYMYVKYNRGGAELFDYRLDPHELQNAIGQEGYAGVKAELRSAAVAACSPVPPRFNWTR